MFTVEIWKSTSEQQFAEVAECTATEMPKTAYSYRNIAIKIWLKKKSLRHRLNCANRRVNQLQHQVTSLRCELLYLKKSEEDKRRIVADFAKSFSNYRPRMKQTVRKSTLNMNIALEESNSDWDSDQWETSDSDSDLTTMRGDRGPVSLNKERMSSSGSDRYEDESWMELSSHDSLSPPKREAHVISCPFEVKIEHRRGGV